MSTSIMIHATHGRATDLTGGIYSPENSQAVTFIIENAGQNVTIFGLPPEKAELLYLMTELDGPYLVELLAAAKHMHDEQEAPE
jgi:hypothetical protein